MKKLADIPLAPNGGFKGYGTLGLENGNDGPSIFNRFLISVVGLLTVVAAIWLLFLVISGAIGIMTAGSDKQKVSAAAIRITNGVIGLFIIIAAVAIIGFFGNLFGFDKILNPGSLIDTIRIQ